MGVVRRPRYRRLPGRRRRSPDCLSRRRHTVGAGGGGIPLFQHSRGVFRPKTGAERAVEWRGPRCLPADRRRYRVVGGTGTAAERPLRQEDASGSGHLESA